MLVVVVKSSSQLLADNMLSPNITSAPFPRVGLLIRVTGDISVMLVTRDTKYAAIPNMVICLI